MKDVVIFRTYSDLSVIALFPYTKWNDSTCASYIKVGQHGGADYYHVLSETRPSLPTEYLTLKKELETMGYDLKVQTRCKASKYLSR